MHPNDNLIYNHVHWNRLSENMDVNGNTNNSISPPKSSKQWESEQDYLRRASDVSNRRFEQAYVFPKSHPIDVIANPLNSKDLLSPTYTNSVVSPTNSLAIVKTDSKCSPKKCSPNKKFMTQSQGALTIRQNQETHKLPIETCILPNIVIVEGFALPSRAKQETCKVPEVVNNEIHSIPLAPKPARKNNDSHPQLSPNTAAHLFDANHTRSHAGHIHAACANPDQLKIAPQFRGKANLVRQPTTNVPGKINKDKISHC